LIPTKPALTPPRGDRTVRPSEMNMKRVNSIVVPKEAAGIVAAVIDVVRAMQHGRTSGF
jgi:aromatic ring hydroxylase